MLLLEPTQFLPLEPALALLRQQVLAQALPLAWLPERPPSVLPAF